MWGLHAVQRLFLARSTVASLLLISPLDKAPLYALHTRSFPRLVLVRGPCERASERATKDDRQPWPRMRGTWLDSQSGGLADGRTDRGTDRGTEGRAGRLAGWLCGRFVKNMYGQCERTSVRNHAPSPSSGRISLGFRSPPSSPRRVIVVGGTEPIDSPLFRSFNSRSSTANITSHPSVRPSLPPSLRPSVRSSFCLESPRASSSLSIGRRALQLCYGRRRHEGEGTSERASELLARTVTASAATAAAEGEGEGGPTMIS